MSQNPFRAADESAAQAASEMGLDVGTIEEVADDAAHGVRVSVADPSGKQPPFAARVLTDVLGDVNVPSVGDVVVIGQVKNGVPFVIGVLPTEEDSFPQYNADERIVARQDGTASVALRDDDVVRTNGAGARWPQRSTDPSASAVPDGTTWYNTTDDEFRGVKGGTVVTFSTSP